MCILHYTDIFFAFSIPVNYNSIFISRNKLTPAFRKLHTHNPSIFLILIRYQYLHSSKPIFHIENNNLIIFPGNSKKSLFKWSNCCYFHFELYLNTNLLEALNLWQNLIFVREIWYVKRHFHRFCNELLDNFFVNLTEFINVFYRLSMKILFYNCKYFLFRLRLLLVISWDQYIF